MRHPKLASLPAWLAVGASLLLALASCLGSGGEGNEAGQESAAAGAPAAGAPTSPSALQPPLVSPPEAFLVQAVRELDLALASGGLERYLEVFSSDPAAGFRLDVTGFATDPQAPFSAPGAGLIGAYQRRQRYLVHYRDAHLRDWPQLLRSYAWEEEAGSYSLAGRDCRLYRARSLHGFGSVELYVDRSNGMVLGWTLQDAQGKAVQALRTTALDWNPSFPGMTWSAPAAGERTYSGRQDDLLLGFRPLEARYAPDGFETTRRLILTPYDPSLDIIYLEILDDGLQVFLTAQMKAPPGGAAGGQQGPQFAARMAVLGGIRVLEGEIRGRHVFVVGSLPEDELLAVFGSMAEPQ